MRTANFKLGVVIPLKSRQVASDWSVVCDALGRTVASVLAQSSEAYQVAVVGHERPPFLEGREAAERAFGAAAQRLQFVDASDHPPPAIAGVSGEQRQVLFERDRCRKIARGIAWLDERIGGFTHWFALDADDLVNREFVAILARDLDPSSAAVVCSGYFYYTGIGRIRRTREFAAYCGSSSVLPTSMFKLPADPDAIRFDETPFGCIPHVHMQEHLDGLGVPVLIPHEPLMMYVQDTGENISVHYYRGLLPRLKQWLVRRVFSQTADAAVADSFCLRWRSDV